MALYNKFGKELDATCEKLGLPKSYAHKDINVGMSGGERKKLELVQIANKQNKMKNNEKKKENLLLNSFCFNNKLEKN